MCEKLDLCRKRVYVYWVEMQKGPRIVLSFDRGLKIKADFEEVGLGVDGWPGVWKTTYYYRPERIADFIPSGVERKNPLTEVYEEMRMNMERRKAEEDRGWF